MSQAINGARSRGFDVQNIKADIDRRHTMSQIADRNDVHAGFRNGYDGVFIDSTLSYGNCPAVYNFHSLANFVQIQVIEHNDLGVRREGFFNHFH